MNVRDLQYTYFFFKHTFYFKGVFGVIFPINIQVFSITNNV